MKKVYSSSQFLRDNDFELHESELVSTNSGNLIWVLSDSYILIELSDKFISTKNLV